MRVLLVLATIMAMAFAMKTASQSMIYSEFKNFALKYNKTYDTPQIQQQAMEIYVMNKKIAAELQALNPKATFGDSPFMDIHPDEFARTHLMPKEIYADFTIDPAVDPVMDASEFMLEDPSAMPTEYDWRSKGAVTPVYNQMECGSCWAFSATEEIESMNQIKGFGLNSESMQQIVSCDTTAYGCQGGWTYAAYEYVMSVNGIEKYSDYPYTSGSGNSGTCQFNAADIQEDIASWSYVTQNDDETAMQNFVYTEGPLSVCVDASSWQTYSGGVITNCGNQIDHCVQITGFSSQSGTPAWNVRNSWGTTWGNQGYLYVERGQNMCSIGDVVTTVVPVKP
jgi:C1A family cysteine protease